MSKSRSTSKRATSTPTPGVPLSIPIRRRTTGEMAELFGFFSDPAGSESTPTFTDETRTVRATSTRKDCEYDMEFSADNQHPIAVHCTVHDWYGEISRG